MKEKTMSFEERLYDAMWAQDSIMLIRMKEKSPEELKHRIDFCAQLWNDGRCFKQDSNNPFDLKLYRDENCDESEEIKEAARQLIAEFRQKTVDRWLKTISHDDAQRIIDVLDHDPDFMAHSDASITFNGVKLPLKDFAKRWNKANGAEQYPDEVYVKPNDNDFIW